MEKEFKIFGFIIAIRKERKEIISHKPKKCYKCNNPEYMHGLCESHNIDRAFGF